MNRNADVKLTTRARLSVTGRGCEILRKSAKRRALRNQSECVPEYSGREFACQHCGGLFQKAGRRGPSVPKYCSASCRARAADQRIREQRKAEGLAAVVHAPRSAVYFPTCRFCGVIYSTRANKSFSCSSPSCRAANARAREVARDERFKAEHGISRTTFYMQKWSVEAPEKLEARREQTRAYQRAIGWTAAKATHGKLRRARKAGVQSERIAPAFIYRRDEYMCHICGIKIDEALSYPDAMSASIDHVIPLSRGGSHTAGNIKAAHLLCNVSKGNRLTVQGGSR